MKLKMGQAGLAVPEDGQYRFFPSDRRKDQRGTERDMAICTDFGGLKSHRHIDRLRIAAAG
jgi:hypothetical protein